MIRLAALLMTALVALPAAAQSCGGPDAPCEIAGGLYHAAAPEGAASGPRPAVVFLHGWGGRGENVIRNGGMVNRALERGYVVLAPQGTPRRQDDAGGSWNSFGSGEKRDDVAFLQAVADDAVGRHGVDRGRILLAGMSGGGMMTWRVACDAPEAFAAYAPIAGLLWRPLPDACAGPMRMLHTHGWADPVVPIEGRSVAGGRITQGDLFAGLDLLRRAMGCARDDPDGYAASGAFLIRRWTDCAPGAELALALHPGGHTIPRGWVDLALDWFEGRSPAE